MGSATNGRHDFSLELIIYVNLQYGTNKGKTRTS